MTTGNDVFEMQAGSGWQRGLNNLLSAEFGRWFKTKMWWIQILVWTGLINVILFFMAVADTGVPGNSGLGAFETGLAPRIPSG
jgi:hypothetical protein